jgi:hypothetical protein
LKGGFYQISATGAIATGGTQKKFALKKGSTAIATSDMNSSIATSINISTNIKLLVDEIITLHGTQTSGGALNATSATLRITKLADI